VGRWFCCREKKVAPLHGKGEHTVQKADVVGGLLTRGRERNCNFALIGEREEQRSHGGLGGGERGLASNQYHSSDIQTLCARRGGELGRNADHQVFSAAKITTMGGKRGINVRIHYWILF